MAFIYQPYCVILSVIPGIQSQKSRSKLIQSSLLNSVINTPLFIELCVAMILRFNVVLEFEII